MKSHIIARRDSPRVARSVSLLTTQEAQTLAAELPDTIWAAELQLRVIGPSGAPAALVAAAENFLRFGPDASGRLLAATALDKADQAERAGELLVTIAHETNASPLHDPMPTPRYSSHSASAGYGTTHEPSSLPGSNSRAIYLAPINE